MGDIKEGVGCETNKCLCQAGNLGNGIEYINEAVATACSDSDDQAAATSFLKAYCSERLASVSGDVSGATTGAFTITVTVTHTAAVATATVSSMAVAGHSYGFTFTEFWFTGGLIVWRLLTLLLG
jgi:hypothetical protein